MKKLISVMLLHDDDTEIASLTDYLNVLEHDRKIDPLAKNLNAGFKLHTVEQTEVAKTLYPGQLNIIILQFEEALLRLKENKPAILQFGEYGGEGGAYILITREGEQADLSVVDISSSVDGYLPIKDTIGYAEKLYANAEENRAVLNTIPPKDTIYFRHVKMPFPDLLYSLESEAAAGRKLFSLLNRDLDNTIY
jgi:hypothetical protein